jgi:cellulose biosynthesis protein BcsQ
LKDLSIDFKNLRDNQYTGPTGPTGPSEVIREIKAPDNLEQLILKEGKRYDFIIVDTPGMTLHHTTDIIIKMADTIVCPINESFIDLEALKDSLFFNQLCFPIRQIWFFKFFE